MKKAKILKLFGKIKWDFSLVLKHCDESKIPLKILLRTLADQKIAEFFVQLLERNESRCDFSFRSISPKCCSVILLLHQVSSLLGLSSWVHGLLLQYKSSISVFWTKNEMVFLPAKKKEWRVTSNSDVTKWTHNYFSARRWCFILKAAEQPHQLYRVKYSSRKISFRSFFSGCSPLWKYFS